MAVITAPGSSWRWRVRAFILFHFLVILLLGLSRHWGYMSSINDLGVFDQAVWGTLNGEFLLNTSNPLGIPINWLGFHFHPVLLLFVPFYAISPSVEWFTVAQSAALSFSAWPIFLLASRVGRSEKVGLLWALAYLVNPFFLNAAVWDFHPIVLAVPFIAIALLAIEKSDGRMLFFSCLPLLFIQEHLGLTVAGFGLLWWLRCRSWQTAIGLIFLGVVHAMLVIGLVMPAFSPTGGHLMISGNLGQLSRYSWLGNSASEIMQNLVSYPLAVAEALIFQTDGITYLALLLTPFLGYPLAAFGLLLPALPDLAANLLSSNSMPRSAFSYHSASLVPMLAAAAIYGARSISLHTSRFSLVELTGLSLAASLAAGYGLSPLPLPGARNLWAANPFISLPDPSVAMIREAVGGERSLSVQANVGAHFSQRREIHPYPGKIGQVDAIILRLASPTFNLGPHEPWFDGTLAWHLQMQTGDFLSSVECLLQGHAYGILLWDDPWLVLEKNAAASSLMQQKVRLRLSQLQREWQLAPMQTQAERGNSPCGEPQARISQTPITAR